MLEFPAKPRKVLRWGDENHSFLFDATSGALLYCTPLFNDLLANCADMGREELVARLAEKHRIEDIQSLLGELDQINGQLQLFETPGTPGPFCYTEAMIEDGLVDSVTLTLTHDCNLRCSYCFDELDYMQDVAYMMEKVAKAAVDLLFREAHAGKDCHVIYTGGEPLLNWSVLELATEYAEARAAERGVGVSFLLKTNGTMLTEEALSFCHHHGFSLQVSIDGQEQDHDNARHDGVGNGSFEAALEGLKRAVQVCGEDQVRIHATVTHQNVARLRDNLVFLVGLGAGRVSAGPVMAAQDSPHQLTPEDVLTRRQQKLDLVADLMSSPGSTAHRRLLKCLGYDSLTSAPAGARGQYGCGAGLWNLAVDTDGSILPCYRLAGDRRYDMGSVHQVEVDRLREVQKRVLPVYNRDHDPVCRDCWGQVYCRESCVASRLLQLDDGDRQCEDTVSIVKALLQQVTENPSVRRALHRL
jgi:uncharacterized protein